MVWISFLAAAVPIVLLAPIVALDATARKLFSVAVPGTLEIGEYCIFAITFWPDPGCSGSAVSPIPGRYALSVTNYATTKTTSFPSSS